MLWLKRGIWANPYPFFFSPSLHPLPSPSQMSRTKEIILQLPGQRWNAAAVTLTALASCRWLLLTFLTLETIRSHGTLWKPRVPGFSLKYSFLWQGVSLWIPSGGASAFTTSSLASGAPNKQKCMQSYSCSWVGCQTVFLVFLKPEIHNKGALASLWFCLKWMEFGMMMCEEAESFVVMATENSSFR